MELLPKLNIVNIMAYGFIFSVIFVFSIKIILIKIVQDNYNIIRARNNYNI